jgi:hypothetical protein
MGGPRGEPRQAPGACLLRARTREPSSCFQFPGEREQPTSAVEFEKPHIAYAQKLLDLLLDDTPQV